jgi:hypothetical protein
VRSIGLPEDTDMATSNAEISTSPSYSIPARTSSRLPNGTSSSSYAPLSPPLPPSQSDRASSLIGNLLLRGYSLLGENCPNVTCRGIPLVGHPKKRGETQTEKRECVICGSVYDIDGELISRPSRPVESSTASTSTLTAGDATSNEARRRALYDEGQRINASVASAEQTGGLSSRLVNGDTATPVVASSQRQDTDMEIDAMLAEENGTIGSSVVSDLVTAQRRLDPLTERFGSNLHPPTHS